MFLGAAAGGAAVLGLGCFGLLLGSAIVVPPCLLCMFGVGVRQKTSQPWLRTQGGSVYSPPAIGA